MAWDDEQTAESCIAPADWNDLVDYIQTVSCPEKSQTTFYIYSDCTNSTGQKFKFAFLDTESILEGGDSLGDTFIIKANSNDTYPFIRLSGNAGILLNVPNEFEIGFLEGGDQFFLFDRSGTSSLLYGGEDTGDSLKILANTTDTYPFMIFEGDDYVEIRTTNDIYFYEQAARMFKFSLSGTTSIIYGGADAGDDLFIYPNDNDSCSVLKLWGDSGIDVLIKAGSIFDVSTCSAETLFEIDSGSKHVDFHCLDAHNFVLELRTTDPSSPTCIGQIWFRTDLV